MTCVFRRQPSTRLQSGTLIPDGDDYRLATSFFECSGAPMAEALVFMANNTHTDPEKDRRGCWKRGMIVVIRPDGHVWGAREDPAQNAPPRKFAVLKFLGISVARLEKYLLPQPDEFLPDVRFRRRLWQIQHAELPLAARQKIAQEGVLEIGPTGDYTWDQVKGFFMRLDTNARETETLAEVIG